MKKHLAFACTSLACASLFLSGCTTSPDTAKMAATPADTLAYPYKATYSSDITVPGSTANAHTVLKVWKMFETADIQGMKPYFADTVMYDDVSGMRFHGPADSLLAYAKKDIAGLDSMRFDIAVWQSAHINDKNEDWVSIWSTERRYPKNGKPDTVLMQENWKLQNSRVVYFNQFLAKLPR